MDSRFTKSEWKVMQILWKKGELKPSQIQELFPEPIENNSLRGILAILCEKGHVTRRMVGKAYLYQAAAPRENAMQGLVRQLVDTFCNGSMETFMAHLIRKEKMTEKDLLELKRIAEDAGKKPNPQKAK